MEGKEMTKELMTAKELRAAIRKAKIVYVSPRFGCSEHVIEVTKKAALEFVAATVSEETTPREAEMFGGSFGELTETGEVYIG
jgi:hypothetical protein